MAVKIDSGQQYLSPLSVKFSATILDDLAKFTVTHDFYNDSKASLAAADFTFPLLPEFSILDFRCSFGGVPGKNRILKAVVLDRGVAREEFDLRLKEGKKTALLEQSSGDVFRSAVGNVPAEARIQTEITLAGFLRRCVRPDETIVTTVTIPISICHRYGFPPPEWKRSGQPLPPLGLSAELHIHTEDPEKTSVKLVSNHQEYTTFEKPTSGHRRNGAFVSAITVVKIENKDPHQKGDVVLDIIKGPKHDVAQAWLEAHTTKLNYYAAMITLPKSATQSIHVTRSGVKRDIIFLADRSGSMAGERMEGLIKAMTVFLKGIPTDRYFNVWCFGTQHQAFWPKSVRYTEENLVYALERVKEFKADMGGTEIQPALEDIIRTSATDAEANDVVVLTDGAVINDITEATVQLVAKAKHDTGGRMRFFALGIGDEVSHALVTGIARAGGGYSNVIGTADYGVWPERMAAVLGAATEEHLGSVQVQVDAHDIVQPRQASSFERPSPLQSPADLASLPAFSHNRIFMLFEPQVWKRGPPSSITVVTRNPSRAIISREIINVHKTAPNTLIHKLAARAAIGDLERSESWVQLNPRGPVRGSEKDKELTKQEGVRLGCEWNLVSKWTSFYLAESCYLGDSDPFLSTPPQSTKQNRRSSSISYDNYTNSVGSSSRHDKKLSSVLSNGSSSLNSPQRPKFSGSLLRDSSVATEKPIATPSPIISAGSHRAQEVYSSSTFKIPPEMENNDNNDVQPWVLTDFGVSAPILNPPASSVDYEAQNLYKTQQTKASDFEKKKVLELIDHQKYDGSFKFKDPQVAETIRSKEEMRPRRQGILSRLLSRSGSSQSKLQKKNPLSIAVHAGSSPKQAQGSSRDNSKNPLGNKTYKNDLPKNGLPRNDVTENHFLGNHFKMVTKLLHDLAQLSPSLPDTIATIVLFERDLNDYSTLFSQSLRKAYTFVEDLIPDPEERSAWMNYARDTLTGKPTAAKPPLPKIKRKIYVCPDCGKTMKEQSREPSEQVTSGETIARKVS